MSSFSTTSNLIVLFCCLYFFSCPTLLAQENLTTLDYQILDSLAKKFFQEGALDEAIPYLDAGRQKAETEFGKNDSIFINYTTDLGFFYKNKNDFQKAADYYNEAQKLQASISKKSALYAKIINNIGLLEQTKGDYPKAEALLIEAAKIRASVLGHTHSDYAQSLSGLGEFFKTTGKYDLAKDYYTESAEIYAQTHGKEHPYYATSLDNLGTIYNTLGDNIKAEEFYKASMLIREKALGKEHPKYGGSLISLASIYFSRGQYHLAEPLLLQAKITYQKAHGKAHFEYGTALNWLGHLYQTTGKYVTAEAYLVETKEVYAIALGKEHPYYGHSLNGLANLYKAIGNFDKAEPLFLEAIDISLKKFGDKHLNYAENLHNLAVLYQAMNNYSKAEALYITSKNIRAASLGTNHATYAKSLLSLASVYKAMDNNRQALALYKEAKNINAALLGKMHPDYASNLNHLALLYLKIDSLALAKPLLEEAKNIYFQTFGPNHPRYATALNNLAGFYNELGDYKMAKVLFEEASNCYRSTLGTEHHEYAAGLNNLAGAYLKLNKADSAYKYCQASFDANAFEINSTFSNFEKLDQHQYYSIRRANFSIQTLLDISKYNYEKKKLKADLESLYKITKAAIRLNENYRNSISTQEDKLSFLSSYNSFTKQAIEYAILLEDNLYLKEAFSFAELNKSILLADAVKGNRARTLGDLPDTLVEKEILLQTQEDQIKKEIALAKTVEAQNLANKKLAAFTLQKDLFIKSLKDKYPKYHQYKYENITANAKDIQTILDKESLLLEYFVSDSMIYLFALSKENLEVFSIPITQKELNKQVKRLRQALSDYTFISKKKEKAYHLFIESAHWCYNNLVKIALEGKDMRNLIIVTDGALGHLPFETFLVDASNEQEVNYSNLHYLNQDFNISYNYSSTILKENINAKKKANNQKIMAFAAAYPKVDSNLLNLRSYPVFKLRSALSPLPAAENEVKALKEAFQGAFLFGTNSNEKFFKEEAKNYAVIHLAMHGILHPRTPMLSSLAFTENQDSLEDNFLQAYEISQLELNADLVVLSACETGFGKFEQGEGVVSLARSFMYAGVPSLVVSLWPVNDHATALIMKSFYKNLSIGMAKDEALKEAKLEYLQVATDLLAHPAFWSAFIQIGNTNPVQIKSNSNPLVWGMSLALVALLGIGAMAWRKRKLA